jgi:hypothetical protein
MRFSNLLTIAILTISMSACDTSKGIDAPDEKQNEGTFFVNNLSGETLVSKVDSYHIPTQKTYNFKACLKDRLHNKDIKNQFFSISNDKELIATERSNENGCLHWSEYINYNFSQQSKYLTIKRTITSQGVHKGSFNVFMAINPWGHGEKLSEVIDLSKNSVPYRFDIEKSNQHIQAAPSKPIYLNALDLKFTESSNSGQISYDVEVTTIPNILVQNTKGQYVEEQILAGNFKYELMLIHETANSGQIDKKILASSGLITSQSIKGKLKSRLKLTIPRIPTDGFYRVAIEVKPSNADHLFLRSGVAIFDLGHAGAISGQKKGVLLNEVVQKLGNYNLDSYIAKDLKSTQILDDSYVRSGVYVKENISIRFMSFANETTTERDVVFEVTACFGRSDSKQIGLRDIEVQKIQMINGKRVSKSRPLLPNRCITWQDSFRHKYFIPERKFLKSFILKNKDLALDVEIPVLINPWDFGFTFGRDARNQEQEVIDKESTEERPPSTFYLRDYRFVEQGTSYTIDDKFALTQISHLRFSLDPKAERPSSQTKGINQVEKLRKGKYLFRVLIRRNTVENQEKSGEYITHGQTITTVTDGNMVADLDLHIDRQTLLRSRNRILIQLATVKEDLIEKVDEIHFKPKKGLTYSNIIDEESGLKPAIFEGPIILSSSSGMSRVYPYFLNDFNIQKNRLLSEYARSQSNPFLRSNFLFFPENVTTDIQKYIDLGVIKKNADRNIQRSLAKSYTSHNKLKDYYFNNETKISSFKEEFLKGQYLNKSRNYIKQLKRDDIKALIKNPHNKEFKKALCYYLSYGLLSKDNFQGRDIFKELKYPTQRTFLQNCLTKSSPSFVDRAIRSIKDDRILKSSFSFTRQYKASSVEYLEHLKGIPYTYGIKTSYSLGMSRSLGLDAGIKVPFPGAMFGVSGGGGASVGWRWSKGLSTGTGLGLSLNIEENIEKMRLHKPKQCLVIRLGNALINNVIPNLRRIQRKEPVFGYFAEGQLRSIGLFLCMDSDEDYIDKQEHYYYMEQSPGPGIFQDPTDTRNRQVKIQLRGQTEFYTFIENFEGELSNPNTTNTKADIFSNIYDFMSSHVNSTPANYPGIYTDIEESSKMFEAAFD